MLNLRKRIKTLQETTSSIEAKQMCKEILENFINMPDNQLASILAEKLQNINDADKHVDQFVNMASKFSNITNLGVQKSLSELTETRNAYKEMQIHNYPALIYNLNKIESALKIQKMPEYMVIDNIIESLKTFTWMPIIEKLHNLLKENREKHDEHITIAQSMYTIKNMKGSFLYDNVYDKLEEHFINPTYSSRNSIIEDLKKLNFTPEIRSISENLKRIHSKNGGVQIIAENSKCEISSVYSPVILHENKEIFFTRGNFYAKKDNIIEKLHDTKHLSDDYLELCRIVSSPSVFIKEGKVQFFIKRNKVEIFNNKEEERVNVSFNGNNIPTSDLAKHMVSAGMFRIDEAQIAYDVQKITESFNDIYEIDFAKIIESKIYGGVYAIIMKTGNNISLTKVNESVKMNEFYTKLSATKARNIVLEFLGYDIKESLAEYISEDEKILNRLKQTKIRLAKDIAILEGQLSKINSAEKDELLKNNPELKSLKRTLKSEVFKLKEEYSKICKNINSAETAINESGYEVGDQVKINSSGELATISSINSSRGTVIVITSNGASHELDMNKISQADTIVIKNADRNEKKGEMIITEENEMESSSDFIEAIISKDYDGKFAGSSVNISSSDYTSKGNDDLIEVQIEGKTYYIEKKYIVIKVEDVLDVNEEQYTENKKKFINKEYNIIHSLEQAIDNLERMKDDMKSTFSPSEHLISLINSMKGVLNSLEKNQASLQEHLKLNELYEIDPRKSIESFIEKNEELLDIGTKILEELKYMNDDSNSKFKEDIELHLEATKELIKRAKKITKSNDLAASINKEGLISYPNYSKTEKYTNKVWFSALGSWIELVSKLN